MRYTNWPQLNPGKLRTLVTLLEQVPGSDASGAIATYVADDPPITAMMDVEYLRGNDALRAGQDVSQAWLTATSWFNPAFTAQKQIQVAGDGTYVIQSVENPRLMNVIMSLFCLRIGP